MIPLSTGASAVFLNTAELRKKYTYMSKFGDIVPCYRLVGDYIHVPRNSVPLGESDNRDKGIDVKFEDNFIPRNADQSRVVAESVDFLKKDDSHVFNADCGFGKTICLTTVASRIGKRFLVLIHKDDLAKNWIEAFKLILGLDDSEICLWKGGVVPKPEHKAVIGMVQSVMKGPDRWGSAAYRGYGLVMADEVHILGAEKFSECMWYLPAKLRLGCSATVDRPDQMDIIFKGHIGQVQVVGNTVSLEFKVLIYNSEYKIPIGWNGKPVHHDYGRTIGLCKSMAKCQSRNDTVGHFVASAMKKDRYIAVMADTVDQLKGFQKSILENGGKARDIGWYVGLDSGVYEGKKKERGAEREAASKRRVLLCTMKMFSTGSDIPRLDTIILGSPKADVRQIIGRVRRQHPDKKDVVVLDIVDKCSKVLRAYANTRRKWYDSLGYEVKVIGES